MQTTHRLAPLRLAPLLGLAALGLIARPAAAQTFNFNATINYTTKTDVYVGTFSSGTDPTYSPTVNLISPGLVDGDMHVNTNSVLNVRGGGISDILFCFDTSTVNVTGGSVGSFVAAIEPYHINTNLSIYNASTVNISGGTFGQRNGVNFLDETTGGFTFFGSGLSYIADPGGNTIDGGTDYTLTGRLQDGQSVTGDVIEVGASAAMFTVRNGAPVPEASTALLLSSGVLCLAGLARRRSPRRQR